MEKKLVPISLCCLLQTSIWVDFCHADLPVSCPFLSRCSLQLCPVYIATTTTIYTGFLFDCSYPCCCLQQSTLEVPHLNKFFFQFCAGNIYVKRVECFFIKIHLLYYFKILLYEEHCQKYVICILPVIFLNLVLLTQFCNFLSYWTESTWFIVTLVRSQVQIFFLDYLIFFSLLQNTFVSVTFSEIICPLHSRCLDIK